MNQLRVEVHVRPSKAHYLASSHPGVRGEHERGTQPLAVEHSEETLELGCVPDAHLGPRCLRGGALRRAGPLSRIADEAAFAHRVDEGLVQDAMYVATARGARPGPVTARVPTAG